MNQFNIGGWGPVPPELLELHKKVSVSGIMECYESPAHYESTYILKERDESQAMRLGTAIHMAVLEPDKFEKTYFPEPISVPAGVLSTGDEIKAECKKNGLKVSGTKAELVKLLQGAGLGFQLYDDWLSQEANGKEVISRQDYASCVRARNRIKNNPNLNYFVSGGEPEKLGWALHERTGVIISFKPDYYKEFKSPIMGFDAVVMDLKKVPDVRKRKFETLLWERNLFIQAALYVDLMEALTKKRTLFMWTVMESAPPTPVMGYPCDIGLLDAGRAEYNKTLDTMVECFKTGTWPIYSNALEEVTLPRYAWDQLEYKDDEYQPQVNKEEGFQNEHRG